MNFGILEALLIPEIATEADDITKQVNDIMGGKNAPAENRTDDQREEDLTQTDNIFDDIQKDADEDNPQDNPVNDDTPDDPNEDQDNNPDDPNAPPTDGETSDDIPNMDDTSDEDPNATGEDDQSFDDTGMDDGTGEEDQAEKSIFSDKNTLKKNMIYFFNIIRYTISSLEDALGSTDDQETIRVVNSVIHNLYSTKDVLYDILTKEIESSPYEVLTTKYITIKRIYDISCDMLEEHFKSNPNSKVKYKRFRNKSK